MADKNNCQELAATTIHYIVITDFNGSFRYLPSRGLSKYLTLEKYYLDVVKALEKGETINTLTITDLVIEKENIYKQMELLAPSFKETV
jgi:hypothetical protein